MKNKYNLIVSIISLAIVIVVLSGVSYSYFVYNKDIADVSLSSGTINLDFSKTENTTSVISDQPVSDNLGMIWKTYLEFTVNGTVDEEAILYELEVIPVNGNTIDGQYVKFYLTEVINNTETPLMSPMRYSELYDSLANNGKGMYQEILTGNQDGTSKNTTHVYRLRAWLSDDYKNSSGGNFNYSIYTYAYNINAENYRKVTFKFDDEREEALSKYVELGKEYGVLPTPTKQGYTFLGWNGKNLLNLSNYVSNKSWLSITGENIIINNVGDKYAEYASSYFYLENGKKYTISYHIDGQFNGVIYAFFGTQISGTTNSKTFLFNSDGDKNRFTVFQNRSLINGYDTNIYLVTDRVIISNIQLEEGSKATPYEPYYITSDTEVTEWNKPMVLIAKYDKLPEIELSKETYIEEDLTQWTANNITIDNGVVTLNNTSSTLSSDFIPVNGDFWYITFDAYTNNPRTGSNRGAFCAETYFYDSNKNATTSIANITSDGASSSLALNEWNIDKMYNDTVENVKNRKLYGPNVQYVKISFRYNSQWSSVPLSLRNAKIHGQMSNSFYLINVDVNEDYDVIRLRYAKGEKSLGYMKNNGLSVSNNQIRVTENGIYTVYAKYIDGYEALYTIEITNIIE